MRPPPFVLRAAAAHFERQQRNAHANAERQQAALLRRILRRYRDTVLAAELGVRDIQSAAQFRREVPARSTADYLPIWNRAKAENRPGMVHPQALRYMALKTNGLNQCLPAPKEQFDAYRLFTNHCFFHAFRELNDYSLLSENILVTSGPPLHEITDSGITIGYGSGLATLEAPKFSRQLVRPTRPVLEIGNWQDKIRATIAESYPLDIRVLTGVPNSVVPLLEYLLEYAREQGSTATCARDVWPNLRIYAYSGSPVALWQEKLRALLGPEVHFYELYSSTESPVAYQRRFGEEGLLVDLSVACFEFLPADAPRDTERLGIHQVQVGVPYDIYVTTPSGLFAYGLGDRVEFLGTAPYVLRFAGRAREEISIGIERLTLPFVRACLAEAQAATGVAVRQFFVCPSAPDDAGLTYHWYVELEGEGSAADAQRLIADTDVRLCAGNDGYRGARRNDTVMRPPLVTRLRPGAIEGYTLRSGSFGQSKVANLFDSREVPERILASARERDEVLS